MDTVTVSKLIIVVTHLIALCAGLAFGSFAKSEDLGIWGFLIAAIGAVALTVSFLIS